MTENRKEPLPSERPTFLSLATRLWRAEGCVERGEHLCAIDEFAFVQMAIRLGSLVFDLNSEEIDWLEDKSKALGEHILHVSLEIDTLQAVLLFGVLA